MMDLLNNLLSDHLISSISLTLLHTLWQAPLIALLLWVLLASRPHVTARYRYNASYASILLIFLTALITFTFYFGKEFINLSSTSPSLIQNSILDTGVLGNASFGRQSVFKSIYGYQYHIAWTWILGAFLFSLRIFAGAIYLQRLKKSLSFDIPPVLAMRTNRLIQKMNIKRNLRVAITDKIDVPMMMGHFKPIVILPLAAVNQLSVEEVEIVLAHEMSHILRKDFLQNIILVFIESLFFYHPAVWWISSIINEEREHCCDDLTVNIIPDRLKYAKALVKLQEMRVRNAPSLAMTIFQHKKHFMKRLQRILNDTSYRGRVQEKFMATTFMLLALVTLCSAGHFKPSIKIDESIPLDRLEKSGVKSIIVEHTILPEANLIAVTGAYENDLMPEKKPFINDYVLTIHKKNGEQLSLSNGKMEMVAFDNPVPVLLEETPSDTIDEEQWQEKRKVLREKARKLRDEMRQKSSEMRKNRKEIQEKLEIELKGFRDQQRSFQKQHRSQMQKIRRKALENKSELRDLMRRYRNDLKEELKKRSIIVHSDDEPFIFFNGDNTDELEITLEDLSGQLADEHTELIASIALEEALTRLENADDLIDPEIFLKIEHADLAVPEDIFIELDALLPHMADNIDLTNDFIKAHAHVRELEHDPMIWNMYVGYSSDNDLRKKLVDELRKDGLFVEKGSNTFDMTHKSLKINGQKQSPDLYAKYKSLIKKYEKSAFEGKTKIKLKMKGNDIGEGEITSYQFDIKN